MTPSLIRSTADDSTDAWPIRRILRSSGVQSAILTVLGRIKAAFAWQSGEMPSAGSAVAFRDATLSDVLAVVDLVQSAYRGEASREAGPRKLTYLMEAGLTPTLC